MTNLATFLSDIHGGYCITEAEAVRLLNRCDRDVFRIAAAADEMREHRTGML